MAIKRQVFTAFDLQMAYDKAERRVELTATVSEVVADAFENAKALQAEGSSVVVTDIAGPDSFLAPTHGLSSESGSLRDFCFSRRAAFCSDDPGSSATKRGVHPSGTCLGLP